MIRKPYNLLVVDDMEDICELISDIDEFKDQFSVQTCTNVDEALTIINSEDIRIIISDFHMPGLSGADLLRKAHELRNGIRVIMITGDLSLNTTIDCFLDGAIALIHKPFKPEDITTALQSSIERLDYWYETLQNAN